MNNQTPFYMQSRKRAALSTVALLLIVIVTTAIGYFTTAPVWSKPLTVKIDSWQPTTALPEGLAVHNTVAHGDHLYVVGGKVTSGAPTTKIYGAPINGDGALAGWAEVGVLPIPLYLHATIVVDDALFVIGGWDGGKTVANVWRGSFNADGTIGNWAAMPAYPLALDLHDAVLIDGHIYVVGGWDSLQARQEVYAAAVTAGGLSGWQLVGNLPTPLYRHAVAGANGYLYVTGGYDNRDNAAAAVLVAKVNGTAALGAWQTSPSLPNLTYYHAAVFHDGRLVVLGGSNDTNVFNAVYSAVPGPTGVTGTWAVEPSLPVPIFRFGAVAVTRNGSDYLFVTAGLQSDTVYEAAVYHSTVPLPPTPTATPTATPSPTPTPTPTGALLLNLQNDPISWIGPGDTVTYKVDYRNTGSNTLDDVRIINSVPADATLVQDSVRSSAGTFTIIGTAPNLAIEWQVGDVNPGGSGEVAYAVQRPIPPTPVVPLALDIDLRAPSKATANQQINYTLEVINRAPIALNNLLITDTMPVGATYLSGGDSVTPDGVVQWSIPTLAADSQTTVQYSVIAHTSLVNYDYRASTSEGVRARGRTVAVTTVNGQRPMSGDEYILINTGAVATWGVLGQTESSSNLVYNPQYRVYLSTVQNK
ncbi:MAG: hypothetical protein R2932_57995 [Caldilineaceae bacterium]